jgi:hypothetical protein
VTYLRRIAEDIRREVPPELLPEEGVEPLLLMYAVLARAKGRDVTSEDVHDAWAAWMATVDPSHDSIRPFEELAPDVRAQDEPFAEAIRRVASRWEHGAQVE